MIRRRAGAPAVVHGVAEHPWIRVAVGVLGVVVAALAATLLVVQARGAHRDRIIGQLACQVQRLGGQPVAGASCPPAPSPSPSPGVSRETPTPTVVLTRAPGRPTVVVVPVPASSGASPRRSGSPGPSRSPSSRPRPSPTPTCTPLPVISVCRPTPAGP